MEIIYKKGNIILAPEPFLVHGCNAKGVMGSGVAKAIKEAFPKAYEDYRDAYISGDMKLGMVIPSEWHGKAVFNCITQERYGRDGNQYVDYQAIDKCFRTVNKLVRLNKKLEKVVAMPLIGAGLGGGDWDRIAEIIEKRSINYQPVVYTLDGTLPDGTKVR